MGLLSITIFTRTTPEGQLAVEMYVCRLTAQAGPNNDTPQT